MIYTFVSIGPMALLAALIAVPVYFLIYRRAPEPKQQVLAARYVLMTLTVGVAGFIVGAVAGILIACSPEDAGNLCGLAGIFGLGPFLAALAILFYAHAWSRKTCRTIG